MSDFDEIRREMIASGQPAADLAALDPADERLDTEGLREKYDVLAFAAPFVIVQRKSDGVKGTLEFTHSPRYYFGWRADA
jgi:hypothetical protein